MLVFFLLGFGLCGLLEPVEDFEILLPWVDLRFASLPVVGFGLCDSSALPSPSWSILKPASVYRLNC